MYQRRRIVGDRCHFNRGVGIVAGWYGSIAERASKWEYGYGRMVLIRRMWRAFGTARSMTARRPRLRPTHHALRISLTGHLPRRASASRPSVVPPAAAADSWPR